MFIVFPEGKTEKNYFNKLVTKQNNIVLKTLHKDSSSSPNSLFNYAYNWLNKNCYIKKYNPEIWLIIDYEDHNKRLPKEIPNLYNKCVNQKYKLAINNPIFEYWLLLHFEKGNNINSSRQCLERLKNYLPNYNKPEITIAIAKKLFKKTTDAIQRAKTKINSKDKWPPNNGTNIYLLVEKLI
jgi:hypothetical protein